MSPTHWLANVGEFFAALSRVTAQPSLPIVGKGLGKPIWAFLYERKDSNMVDVAPTQQPTGRPENQINVGGEEPDIVIRIHRGLFWKMLGGGFTMALICGLVSWATVKATLESSEAGRIMKQLRDDQAQADSVQKSAQDILTAINTEYAQAKDIPTRVKTLEVHTNAVGNAFEQLPSLKEGVWDTSVRIPDADPTSKNTFKDKHYRVIFRADGTNHGTFRIELVDGAPPPTPASSTYTWSFGTVRLQYFGGCYTLNDTGDQFFGVDPSNQVIVARWIANAAPGE
jgi:hypothetical protein